MKTCSKCGCAKNDEAFIKKERGRPICKSCLNMRREQLRIKKHVEEEGYIFTTVEQYRFDMRKKIGNRTGNKVSKYGLPPKLSKTMYNRIHAQVTKNNYVFITVEQFEKDMKLLRSSQARIQNKKKRKYDYGTDENITTTQQSKMFVDKMTKAYICQSILRKPVSEVPDEVVETTRNILMLKRELKIGSGIKR